MQNYVISLKSCNERREHIRNQFGQASVNFNFFDAVTPLDNSRLINVFKLKNNKKVLSDIEIACLLSHLSLWFKMINEDIPYLAIFEDDVYLGENASFFLSNHDWIPDDVDIIKLEVTYDKVIISSQTEIKVNPLRCLYRLDSAHLGAGAYIISKKAAINLIEYICSIDSMLPVDEIIFRDLINNRNFRTYQLSPALCIQDIILNNGNEFSKLKSSLDEERGSRMKKERCSFYQKFFREAERLCRQIKLFFFAKKVSFK